MDLSSIFGLNSRFGAVLGEMGRCSAAGSLSPAGRLCLSKSTGFPALPCQVIVASGGWGVCDGDYRCFVMKKGQRLEVRLLNWECCVPRLEARLPVSGLALAMGHGYDAQHVGVIEINDGKRKAAKHEPPGSVQVLWPAPGRPYNLADHIGYGCTKFHRYDWAPAAVPSDCLPEILTRFRVKPEPLTLHQGTL